jgi:hypothetical protein
MAAETPLNLTNNSDKQAGPSLLQRRKMKFQDNIFQRLDCLPKIDKI